MNGFTFLLLWSVALLGGYEYGNSQCTTVLDWSNFKGDTISGSSTYIESVFPISLENVNVTRQINDPNAIADFRDGGIRSTELGDAFDSYAMVLRNDASPTGCITHIFDFDQELDDVSFILLDVDINGIPPTVNWQDSVTVRAYLNGVEVTLGPGDVIRVGSAVQAHYSTFSFAGIDDIAETDTSANVEIQIQGTLDSLVFIYCHGPRIDDPDINVQTAGISDISWTCVELPPVAVDDYDTTNLETPITIDVLANDTDPDNNIDTSSVDTLSGPSHGTVVNNGDGSFTYTPEENFVGVDTFTYIVCDNSVLGAKCDTALVIITVLGEPPVAQNDTVSLQEGATETIAVLANDSDADNDLDVGSVTVVSGPSNGNTEVNPDGSIDYTPLGGFTGSDSFVYVVCDESQPEALCDSATVSITVFPNPGIEPDTFFVTILTDSSVTVCDDVLNTGVDTTGSTTTLCDPGTTSSDNGTWSATDTACLTYVSASVSTEVPDVICVVTEDAEGDRDTTIFVITVLNRPTAPIALDDFDTTEMEVPVTVDLIANDSDINDNLNPASVDTVAGNGPDNGTIVFNGDGSITYSPNDNFVGVETFEYEVCDNTSPTPLCGTATVTIVVTGLAPIAVDDLDSTLSGSPVIIGVAGNDTDPDGNLNPFSVDTLTGSGPDNGTLTVNGDGTITYLSDPGFAGIDVFEYVICDSSYPAALCDTALVTVVVESTVIPVSNDTLTIQVSEDTTIVCVGSPELDIPGQSIDTVIVCGTGPQTNVDASSQDSCVAVLVDIDVFSGPDTVCVIFCDGSPVPNCDTTIFIIVRDFPEPPVAVDDLDTTDLSSPVTIPVVDNDFDPDNDIDTSSLAIVDSASNGSLTVNADGSVTYTPSGSFIGVDTFSYVICDLTTPTPLCDTADVVVVVSPCDFIEEDTITCDEVGQDGTVCIPVPFEEYFSYDVFINGTPYNDIPGLCDLDTLGAYDFSTAISNGVFSGSLNVFLSWVINGSTISLNLPVSDLSELADAMDSLDASGTWVLNGEIVEGGDNQTNYGSIRVLSIDVGIVSVVNYNQNFFSQGSEITVPVGCSYVTFVDSSNAFCRDSILVCRGVPETVIIASADTICAGETVTLTSSEGIFWEWNTGETTGSIVVTPESTTSYSVIASNGDPLCADTAEITIVVNPLPEVQIIASETVFCDSGTVTLDATTSGAAGYTWNTGDSTATIEVFLTATDTFSVVVTDSNGCEGEGSVIIVVSETPTITLVPSDTTICQGETVLLTAQVSSGDSIVWNNGQTGDSILVSPAVTTTFSATVYSSGICLNMDSATVTVLPLPEVIVTPSDTSVCLGDTVGLTAISADALGFVWSTGDTTASITVTPVGVSVYTVTVVNAAGCENSASATVNADPLPLIVLNPGDTTICLGDSITLTAEVTGAESFFWSTGDSTESITVAPATGTTYTITALSPLGCMTMNSVSIDVSPVPVITLDLGDTAICKGETLTITASAFDADTIIWSTGDTGLQITITPGTDTLISVIALTNAGCESEMASVFIEVNESPEIISILASDTVICQGDGVTLLADTTGTGDLIWSTGDTTAEITVTPEITTTYEVIVTGEGTCGDTSSITIEVLPAPTVSVSPAGVGFCGESDTVTLTATVSGADSILWSTGDTSLSIEVVAAVTTTYTVTVVNEFGCEASASATVTVAQDPEILSVNATDTIVCAGDPVSISAETVNAGLVVWSTGDTSSVLEINPLVTTEYTVIAYSVDLLCPADTASITISVNPAPAVAITGTADSVCEETVTLTVITDADDILWSTGDTTTSIEVDPVSTTTYTVTVTNDIGCSSGASFTVKVDCGGFENNTDTITVVISTDTTEVCDEFAAVLELNGPLTAVLECGDGNESNLLIEEVDTCVKIVANFQTFIGPDTLCVVHCSADVCDTTIIIVEAFYEIVKDTITIQISQDTTEVCEEIAEVLDIRNPLIAVLECGDGKESNILIEEVDTCVKIITDISNFAGPDTLCVVHCDLEDCDTTIIIVESAFDINTDTVFVEVSELTTEVCLDEVIDLPGNVDGFAVCDAGRSEEITAIGGTLCVDITIDPELFGAGDTVCVVHCNTGPGICDTTIIVLAPVRPEIDTFFAEVSFETTEVEVCVGSGIDLISVIDTFGVCEGEKGERFAGEEPVQPGDIKVDFNPEDTCVVISIGQEGIGRGDTICIYHCASGVCDTTIIVLTTPPCNEVIAVGDAVYIEEGTFDEEIDVLANDIDTDQDGIVITGILSEPSNGSVQISQSGDVLIYTPNSGYEGVDSLIYEACDREGVGEPGCCDTAWVYIYVGCRIPAGLSPNGDDINDAFEISCLGALGRESAVTLRVFNRYGAEVYRNENYDNSWEGTYDGEPLPDGTYFYTITFTDPLGNQIDQSGYVIIQR